MYGSLFYNFWAALLSFAAYFVWAIQDPFAFPWSTIGTSLIVAIIGFIVMFVVRYFIGYVFYTPENILYSEMEADNAMKVENENNQQFIPKNDRSTVEFEEDNSEEFANVVRTMLHGQDEALS